MLQKMIVFGWVCLTITLHSQTIIDTSHVFSRCYDDRKMQHFLESINVMSDSSFAGICGDINNCMDVMDSVGIIENPCYNIVYRTLHYSDISSLSKREFMILKKLRSDCFEYQEDVDYGYDICEDSIYTKLKLKQQSEQLNSNEVFYLERLKEECVEYLDDIDDDWLPNPEGLATVNYEGSKVNKAFTTTGPMLFIPGVILPVIGSVVLTNVEYSDPGSWVGEFFVRTICGWVFLGLGIGCDCAGITLSTIGAIKKKKANDFLKIKEEYQQFKKKNAVLSLNLDIDF